MRAFYTRNKKYSSFSLIFQLEKETHFLFIQKGGNANIREEDFFLMGNKWNETSTADMRRQTPIVTQM